MTATPSSWQSSVILVAVGLVGVLLAGEPANTNLMSIDFDSDNNVQSGDPTHAEGMSFQGQVGPWYKLSTGGSPGSPSITVPAGTFTFNTTGTAFRTYSTASKLLREDFFWLTDGYGPCHWSLTNLVPNGAYDIICYGRYVPDYGGYRGADMTILGYNNDNPVTQETSFPAEGDWNFSNVVADVEGKIEGTFAWNGNAHAEFCAIQFKLVVIPPPKGMVLIFR